ncbi:30S ribosome-binding factor RbfA [Candidatus Margulisiibacteriota bacterium]
MSTSSHRAIRVAGLVKAEIARTIQTKLNNKDIGFVSIVELKMSNDLSIAKVYVSVFGDQKQKTLKILKQSVSFIRRQIARDLNLRIVPEISFFLDERLERGDNVLKIIKDLNNKDQA